MNIPRFENRLVREKSPYLLQHAHNPVDWFPWGEEAFSKAHREDKPIFLSIGYSTCYWCHVMEREVFENEEIAAQMNAAAVCIKVDREERPDVDRIYMTAVQAMTGSGGWPMSVFLTHDLKPFFGATYIPPKPQYGRPGFPQILERITSLWKSERDKIVSSGEQILEYLKSADNNEQRPVNDVMLMAAFNQFEQHFDKLHAGFGPAPKFPRPAALQFLIRYFGRTGNRTALTMTLDTLRAMASGGMYDQIGGGFHRYSVDARWHVPHFEKMLYDQAQLVIAYLEAFQITADPFFESVARETLDYVSDRLTGPEGGFYSAEDAESAPDPVFIHEKKEGAFYCWTHSEIENILGKEIAPLFCFYYGVLEQGNVEHDPAGIFRKKNILYRAHTVEETAGKFSVTQERCVTLLAEARRLLFAQRAKRPRPQRDDKIISAWNGLMISAFAKAFQIFAKRDDLRAAERAARFVMTNLYDGKKLYRRYRDGERRFNATLQDYAFLIAGLADLFEASGDPKYLRDALQLTQIQIDLFKDASGGFFDSVGNDSSLIVRTKEKYDGAEPAGNSVAAMNLLRLGHLTGNATWKSLGESTIASFGVTLERYPESLPAMLCAAGWLLAPTMEIVIAADSIPAIPAEILNILHHRYLPLKTVILVGSDTKGLASLLPFLDGKSPIAGKPAIYVCSNFACQRPTTDISEFRAILDASGQPHHLMMS